MFKCVGYMAFQNAIFFYHCHRRYSNTTMRFRFQVRDFAMHYTMFQEKYTYITQCYESNSLIALFKWLAEGALHSR